MEIRWDSSVFSIIVKKLSRIFPEFHHPVSSVWISMILSRQMCEEGVTPLFGTLHSAQSTGKQSMRGLLTHVCNRKPTNVWSGQTCGPPQSVVWFQRELPQVEDSFFIVFHIAPQYSRPPSLTQMTQIRHYDALWCAMDTMALQSILTIQCFGRQVWSCEQECFKDSCYGAVVVSPWTRELRITCSPDNTSIRDIQKVRDCKTSPVPSSLPCRVNLGLEGFTISTGSTLRYTTYIYHQARWIRTCHWWMCLLLRLSRP